MSVQTEITRLSNAKSAIKTAIGNKGVTVPSTTKLDGMATLIDQIPTGIDTSNLVLFEVSWKAGRYLNPAGEPKSNSNYNLSSYIPAAPSTTYNISVVKNSTTGTQLVVSCFNGTSHIDRLIAISPSTDTGTKTGTFTTPANCTCIRLSVGKNMSLITIA